MSEVNASDTRPIDSVADVIDTYAGVGKNSKTGVEVELAFFDPNSNDLATMTQCQNKVVKNAANAEKEEEFVRNEPTSEMLEVGSIAGDREDLRAVMRDTQNKIEILTQKAADIGLKRSYFQHLPEKPAAYLLNNLMDIDRYQAFFGPPRGDMLGIAAYFSVCKSNQVSISYQNPDHMLANVRRLYALAPFLFMITDNGAPFNEGEPFKGHAGMHHRASLKGRGGIPPYVFSAKTGEEYITSHIHHVMNNPLFVHYDENGALQKLPSGEWTNFRQLAERGLNTATNYYFSESILWPDVKIAALKDAKGEVVNHRYEARMFGVGLHQHQTALLITAALGFDEAFADAVDSLLIQSDFPLDAPELLKKPLEAAYKAARTHNGKFLDIAYGNTSMHEFAKKFAELLERSSLMMGFEDELLPLLTICQTGCTDSKVNALLFSTLDKVLEFQKSYDSTLFENPNQCARMAFEQEIRSNSKSSSCIAQI